MTDSTDPTAPPPAPADDRRRGDRLGDGLVDHMLGEGERELDGRLGYNHLLDIADALVDAPELAFAPGSEVRRQLGAYREQAEGLAGFFDPVEAPEWLDEAKLARASELWQANMITIVGVLYAASLPACYLIEKGIPALYASGKLARKDYLFQRIYETGLMLDAVMHRGGLHVSHDIDHAADDHLEQAVKTAAGDDAVAWERNHCKAANAEHIDHERVAHELQRRSVTRRYLWGPGFIATRKVRLLHASMRYMLSHPERFRQPREQEVDDRSLAQGLLRELGEDGWQEDLYGVPVNQQDLAYTLLTFGLVIPEGLERWHVHLDQADKEAFLHAWRVVGWVIGIEDHLLPKDWADAQRIRRQIAGEQAKGSEMGRDMTATLMQFLQDYLPHACGLKTSLPAWLIRDQMGPDAPKVLDPGALKASKGPFIRCLGVAIHVGLWTGFTARRFLFEAFPPLRQLVGSTLGEVGQALIESWRDVYRRRPFYIPEDATTWKRKRGVNVPYLEKLMAWRRRIFGYATLGLVLWLLAGVAAITGGVALALGQGWGQWPLWGAAGGLALGVWVLQVTVPRVARKRPRLEQQMVVRL